MNTDLAKRMAVESVQQSVQVATHLVVQTRDELRDLLLCDRGRQVDVPDGQAGEVVIAREQAVQESRSAAEVAQDEERLFNRLCFMTGEENVIQKEKEPVSKTAERPDKIEKKNEGQSFTGKSGRTSEQDRRAARQDRKEE